MPTVPGTHLILIHARLALASLEARLDASARLDDPRQFFQRWLFHLHLGHRRRREVILVAMPGVLISGIARGTGLPRAFVRKRTPGDHQPLLGSQAFALHPCLYPALDHLDVHRPFLPVTYRQMRPRVGRKGLPPRCYRLPRSLGATASP